MKKVYLSSLIILALISSGCSTSAGSDDGIIIASGSQESDLNALDNQNPDLKKTLSSKNWNEVNIDLDKFYPTSIATVKKSYLIDLNFEDGKVTAYADCKKLTARYKINENDISFSKVSYEPAIDLATCQESEDADQAIYEFLNNSFEATEIKEDEITFKSDNFDAQVTLKR